MIALDLARPEWLWLLAPWMLLATWAAWGRRRRDRAWRALGQGGRPPGDGAFGGVIACLLLIVGLAGPRWGTDPGSELPAGRDVVLLVDVSRSMGAEDAVPSRMGVAIESAEGLLAAMAREDGDRVGVVAFAGAGVVRCGLTENLGAVADVVRSLRPGTIRPGGTDLGAAIETAAGAFDDRDHAEGRMIVVFTDGEDLAGGWRDRVEPLRQRGIIVNAVAIGDPDAGHPVPSGEDGRFVSFGGKPVASKRSDEALDALAGATGGAVIRVGLASADMESLYLQKIAPAAKRVRHATHPPERAERYGVFVLAALTTLTLGARPRASRRASRRWGLVVVPILLAVGAGPAGESPGRLIGRGRAAYASRRFDEALAEFEAAVKAAPRSAIARYDAAATLYALGRFPEAIARYREARDRGDDAIAVKVDFALGNASLLAGDPAAAIDHYDACLASTRKSAALDAVRRDAEANRAYAMARLEDKTTTEPEGGGRDEPKGSDRPEPKPARPPPGVGPGDEGPEGGDGPRGGGGAGGSEPDPGPASGPTPQERLDAAMANVREALKDRPPQVPARGPSADPRDW